MSLISLISCKWLFMWKIFFLRYCCFHSKLSLIYARQIFDRPSSLKVKQNITNFLRSVQKFIYKWKTVLKVAKKKTACFFFFFFFGVLIYIDKKNKRRWPGSTRYCKIEKKMGNNSLLHLSSVFFLRPSSDVVLLRFSIYDTNNRANQLIQLIFSIFCSQSPSRLLENKRFVVRQLLVRTLQ